MKSGTETAPDLKKQPNESSTNGHNQRDSGDRLVAVSGVKAGGGDWWLELDRGRRAKGLTAGWS